MQNNLAQAIKRTWWMMGTRAILGLIFGLFVLLVPGLALLTLIYTVAAYILLAGITSVIAAIRERGSLGRWVWVLIEGILGILTGIAAFAYPGLTALFLLYLVATWAIVTGLTQIGATFALRGSAASEWAFGLGGFVSVLFGILLLATRPANGLLALLQVVGIYGIVYGVLQLIRTVQLRLWASRVQEVAMQADPGEPMSDAGSQESLA
jgi:uncharacterized membrane protein HdeD (DUF308 family)